VDRRTWIFVLVGAFVGVAVGLIYVIRYDPLCMCPGLVGPCGCTHDEIFGWQPGVLAVPVWTAVGLVGGVILGFAAARFTRHS
jgi:uncharacterized membrane-anchored protein YhcB (DUF1043 family)